MHTRYFSSLVALSLLTLVALPVHAEDARCVLQHDATGAQVIRDITLIPAGPLEAAPGADNTRSDLDEIWHRHYTDAIYTTASFCGAGGVIGAGTYLNPPKQVETVPIEGDGTPDWTYPGLEYYVAASRDGSIIAGVDYDAAALSVTVRCWQAGSAIPLWSTAIASASRGSERTVSVSADGSTIAVLVTMQTGEPAARLYLYSPASPIPIGIFDGPAGFARNLSLGADGRFAAFIGLATAYVADRDAGTIRWSGSMGASNDPIAISTDGNYLSFGWTSLRMMQWNGTAYATLWTIPGGGYSLKTCSFSDDGQTFASGWYRSDFYQNRVRIFAMPSSSPLWTYDYPVSGGAYQDIPSDIALAPNGETLVVGSWGDQLGINPEVHLFGRDQPTPLATFDTPGSVFDVDLMPDGEGGLFLTACGKTIHANQNGRGGDLYSLRYAGSADIVDGTGRAQDVALREVHPNPVVREAQIEYRLAAPGPVRLCLYDSQGRWIRTLVHDPQEASVHRLAWDGLDQSGRAVAAGAYLLRLEAGGFAETRRLLLLR